MADLHPIHRSINNVSRLPHKMERVWIHGDLREALTDIALSIFTDCVNVGQPFQTALLAIYLSGLQHGSAARDQEDKP